MFERVVYTLSCLIIGVGGMGWSNKMRQGKIIKISWNGGIFRSFSYINSMNFGVFSQNLQFHPKLGTRKYLDTDILKKYDKIPVKILGDNKSQLIFICTKSATETLEKVWNMYKVNNKETRTASLTWYFTPFSSFSTVDFEQENVSWAANVIAGCIKACTCTEKGFYNERYPSNFGKFFRTVSFQDTSARLLPLF